MTPKVTVVVLVVLALDTLVDVTQIYLGCIIQELAKASIILVSIKFANENGT